MATLGALGALSSTYGDGEDSSSENEHENEVQVKVEIKEELEEELGIITPKPDADVTTTTATGPFSAIKSEDGHGHGGGFVAFEDLIIEPEGGTVDTDVGMMPPPPPSYSEFRVKQEPETEDSESDSEAGSDFDHKEKEEDGERNDSGSEPDHEEDDDYDLSSSKEKQRIKAPPRVKGELRFEDLPPIQDLHISVPHEKAKPIGVIKSVVEPLVVVEAHPNTPALDIDSVLFLDQGDRTLGKVFDVMGPVKQPWYCVRFNSLDHINSRGVEPGMHVYCAPATPHASFVLVAQLQQLKGSDASWLNDIEPPPEAQEFSDDETERQSRRKKKKARRRNNDPGMPTPPFANGSHYPPRPPRQAGYVPRHHVPTGPGGYNGGVYQYPYPTYPTAAAPAGYPQWPAYPQNNYPYCPPPPSYSWHNHPAAYHQPPPPPPPPRPQQQPAYKVKLPFPHPLVQQQNAVGTWEVLPNAPPIPGRHFGK